MMCLKFTLAMAVMMISRSLYSQSVVLEDSINGNSSHETVKYTVCLPKKEILQKGKLPILYLLHGLGHIGSDWVRDGKLSSIVEELRKNDRIRDMVIVMPSTHGRKSGFFDVEGDKYETFFFNDFLPAVERKYNAGGEKGKRAIGGFSMGGGAAVVYALKHPEHFSSVYAMSALVALPVMQRVADGQKDSEMFRFGQSVLANDCTALLSYLDTKELEQVKGTGWFLDCGDEDFLLGVNIRYYLQMRRMDVPCELRVRDGNHDWNYWHSSLYDALPFFSRHYTD